MATVFQIQETDGWFRPVRRMSWDQQNYDYGGQYGEYNQYSANHNNQYQQHHHQQHQQQQGRGSPYAVGGGGQSYPAAGAGGGSYQPGYGGDPQYGGGVWSHQQQGQINHNPPGPGQAPTVS